MKKLFFISVLLFLLFGIVVTARLVDVDSLTTPFSVVGDTLVTPSYAERLYHHIYSFETSCQAAGNTFTEWSVQGGVEGFHYEITSPASIVSYGTRASRIGIAFLREGSYVLMARCINQDGSSDLETFRVNVLTACVSTCDVEGELRCVDEQTRQQCGVSSSDSDCLVWDSTWTCNEANGERCVDGRCELVDQCLLGSVECLGGVYAQDYYSCELVDGVNRKVKRVAGIDTVCVGDSLVDRFVEECEGEVLVRFDRLKGDREVIGNCFVENPDLCVDECELDNIVCGVNNVQRCELVDGCKVLVSDVLSVGECGVECLSDIDCPDSISCDVNNKLCDDLVDDDEEGEVIECEGSGLVECSDGFRQSSCDSSTGQWIVENCEPVNQCGAKETVLFGGCVNQLIIPFIIIIIIGLITLFIIRRK